MRWSSLALIALLASCGRCDPPQQSNVDVPTTLGGLRAMDAPPDVVVTVERKQREVSGGAGGCGHSALCVLVLPLVLLGPLFPEKWDAAKVVKNGDVYYEGRFATDGRFLDAVVRDNGVARSIGVLMLDELGRHVIVEIARAPLDAKGEAGEYVRSPILPQIDLARLYADKLAKLTKAQARSALLLEYARWLGAEGNAWLASVVPDEAPASLTLILRDLCPIGPATKADTCDVLLDAVATHPNPESAALALSLSVDRAGVEDQATARRSIERAGRLGRYLVARGCDGDVVVAMGGLTYVRPFRAAAGTERKAGPLDAVASDLVSAARGCATPRRVHLLASLGEEIAEKDATLALTPRTPESRQLARALDADVAAHQRALVVAARARADAAVDDEDLIEALGRSSLPPDGSELSLLARSFARTDGERPWMRRACVIARVDVAARSKIPLDVFATALRASSSVATPADRASYAAARVHVGELDQASIATVAFQGSVHVPHNCGSVTDQSSLVGYALFLAGCTPDEALALQRQASPRSADAGPPVTPEPDRLCTKPIGERGAGGNADRPPDPVPGSAP